MLKDNLISFRNLYGYSQETISEKIGISRQAYAKWEAGTTVPDIEKCVMLADVYGITVDNLVNNKFSREIDMSFLAPKGKNIWGSVMINNRGMLVIPKEARDKFNLTGGSRLIVLSNEDGIALIPSEKFEENMQKIMNMAYR